MNRTGEPSVEALLARIAALQVENRQLTERVVRLEEELALARLHRFAPRSEKHVDRLFNEAEQAADEDDAGSETDNIAELPDTGLPPVENTTGKKRGRRPLPANLPRERVEYDLPDDQKACPCCRGQMHRMGETVTEQLHIRHHIDALNRLIASHQGCAVEISQINILSRVVIASLRLGE